MVIVSPLTVRVVSPSPSYGPNWDDPKQGPEHCIIDTCAFKHCEALGKMEELKRVLGNVYLPHKLEIESGGFGETNPQIRIQKQLLANKDGNETAPSPFLEVEKSTNGRC